MEHKFCDFELKKMGEDGSFEGYASIFRTGKENDLGGDRIRPGSFAKTLKENPDIPLHWYHDLKEPVGEASAEEDSLGLKVNGQLVLEVQRAKELYALMRKTKRVARQLSIGYDAVKFDMEDGVRVISEIKLWEIGLVTFGMDQDAIVTQVKCADCPLKIQSKMELKPYPNEHSARLQDPDKFDPDAYRRKSDGTIYGKIKVPATIDVIWGKLKGHSKPSDNPIPQALRFPTKDWTVAEAKKWLKDNNIEYISFEAAEKSLTSMAKILKEFEIKEISQAITEPDIESIKKAAEALIALLEAAEPPDEDTRKVQEPQINGVEPEMIHSIAEEFRKLKKSKVYGG